MSPDPQVSPTARAGAASGLARIADDQRGGAQTADAILISSLRSRAENAEALLEQQVQVLRETEARVAELTTKVEALEWDKADLERRLSAGEDAAALKAENAELRARIDRVAQAIDGVIFPKDEVSIAPEAAAVAEVSAARVHDEAIETDPDAISYDAFKARAIAWSRSPQRWTVVIAEALGIKPWTVQRWRWKGNIPVEYARKFVALEATEAPEPAAFRMTDDVKARLTEMLGQTPRPTYAVIAKALSAEFRVPITERTIGSYIQRERQSAKAQGDQARVMASAERNAARAPEAVLGRWGETMFVRKGKLERSEPPAPEGFTSIPFAEFERRVRAMAGRSWNKFWKDQTGMGAHMIQYWKQVGRVPAGYAWVLSEVEKSVASADELSADEAAQIGEMLVTEPDLTEAEITKRISRGRGRAISERAIGSFMAKLRRLSAENRDA
jgi:hypothetical protein